MTTPFTNPDGSNSSAHEDSTCVFYDKITGDFGEWFELAEVQGRWFCHGHSLHTGDQVKISIRKASDVRSDRDN